MNFLKRLAGDTIWYGLSSVVSRLILFVIFTPYILRKLDDYEYGVYSLMYVLAAFLIPFFTFRLETAFFRYGSKRGISPSFWTAFTFITFLSLLLSAVLISKAETLSGFLSTVEDQRFIIYICLIGLLDAMSAIPYAYLRLKHKPKVFALIKVLNIAIMLAVVFFFLEALPLFDSQGNTSTSGKFIERFLQYSPAYMLDYFIVANLIASALSLCILIPVTMKRKENPLSWDWGLLRQMLIYSLPLLVVGIAAMINQITDRLLIKRWLPSDLDNSIRSAGTYSAATKLAVIMSLFTQAYNYAAEPFFFQRSESDDARQVYARSAEAFFAVGFLGFLLISLNLNWIKYYLPPDYWEALPIVPYLLMSYLLLGLYYNLSIWYKVSDKTQYGAIISVIGAIPTLGLNYIMIPRIGMLAAAITSILVYSSMCLLCLFFGKRNYPIPYQYSQFLLPLGIFIGLLFYFSVWSEFVFSFSLKSVLVNSLILLLCISLLLLKNKALIKSLLPTSKSS